jgi:HK97 family phage major capsid protein
MNGFQDVKDAVDDLCQGFEAFRHAHDRRIDEVDGRIDQLATALNRTGHGDDGSGPRELRDYKAAYANYLRKGEVEGLAELETKALSVGSDPDGGYTVMPEMSDRIVATIFESSPIRSIATVETISSSSLELIVDDDEPGSGWVAETETRAETTTPQIRKKEIVAHELYAEPRATQKLLDDAGFPLEMWLAGKVADKFARDEAAALVNGDGVGKPRGFLTYPAGTSYGQIEQVNSGNASALTDDGLIDLQNALKEGYLPGAVWVMKRSTIAAVRKLKDSQGQYLWQPGLAQSDPPTLLGHRVVAADDVPAVSANALAVAFGDFQAAYTIVDRIGVRVLRDPFTAKPWVKFYTTKRVGGDVVNFEAIKIQKIST